jgi:hypothetical protein
MTRTASPQVVLTERMCRPQRIGLFGRRGVGKTTFLTMLYREAVGGRLPRLRLAAADARTADYLSDKVLQLEAGQPLPATLGETELRFHLYHGGARLELLVKDYQGEHVAVGREEPIRDFLRDCDAVWLCLDVLDTATPEALLRAEQEVEQLVEDYLAAEPEGALHRPTAVVLTKADLLGEKVLPPGDFVREQFGMTRHALATHFPRNDVFAVSSLGGPIGDKSAAFTPRPSGLEGPLVWLADVLRQQDVARLEQVWPVAGRQSALLDRGVKCFNRRYPDAPEAAAFRRRLRELRRQRLRRRLLSAVAVAACLVFGLWTYDAWGEQRADRFEADNAGDLASVRERWQEFQFWHPTRHLLRPAADRAEKEKMQDLERRIEEERRAERLAELQRRASDPDADPEAVWQQFQRFHADYPDFGADGEKRQFRETLKQRHDAERERLARAAFEELERGEPRADLPALVLQADRFLRDHADTSHEPDVRRRRAAYLRRIDERDFEAARAYSARQPLNFFTRREKYQQYLDRHPEGAFAGEAAEALKAVEAEWDRQDFRAVRDQFQTKPGDVKELSALCRHYLAVHPHGRFRGSANELLRWGEKVTTPTEYHVTLKSGSFDPKVAHLLSRGPNLSVEIEVNGVTHGPSGIARRSSNPEWNYEFPRPVLWKLGDRVRIRVTDHYYWQRLVADVVSEDGDLLAMSLLNGEVQWGKNVLTFASDFALPVLPKVE